MGHVMYMIEKNGIQIARPRSDQVPIGYTIPDVDTKIIKVNS